MTTPEERLRRLDAFRDAPYEHPDAPGMVHRIVAGGPRRRRRRLAVAAAVPASLVAAAAAATGLLVSGGSVALAPLALAAPRIGAPVPLGYGVEGSALTGVRHETAGVAGVLFGSNARYDDFNATALATSTPSGVPSGVPRNLRFVAGHGVATATPPATEVYVLSGPTDPSRSTLSLAGALGMRRASVRSLGRGSWEARAGGARLWANEPIHGTLRPALSWWFQAACAPRPGCPVPAATAQAPELAEWAEAAAKVVLSPTPAKSFKGATAGALVEHGYRVEVPVRLGSHAGPAVVFEFDAGGSVLRAAGLLGTPRGLGAYPIESPLAGVRELQRAASTASGSARRTVVLDRPVLVYLAVTLLDGATALLPTYVYDGSNGLRYAALAVDPAYLRVG